MVMEGDEQLSPEAVNPLVGIPVIVEVKEGKVSASLEEGSPSDGAPNEGMTMNIDGTVEMRQTMVLK